MSLFEQQVVMALEAGYDTEESIAAASGLNAATVKATLRQMSYHPRLHAPYSIGSSQGAGEPIRYHLYRNKQRIETAGPLFATFMSEPEQ